MIVPAAGRGVANTTTYSTGNPIAALILFRGSAGAVNIGNLAVDGTNNGISDCLPDLIRIFYQNSARTLKFESVG